MVQTPREGWTLRYLSRFRCIGADCPDDCCHDWRVDLSRRDHKRLKRAFDGSSRDRSVFRESVHRARGEDASGTAWAHLRPRPDGRCAFLAESGLCRVHRDHGAEALPDLCARFPRWYAIVGERVEMSASLGCPETARLCLLAPDGAEPTGFEPAVTYRDVPQLRFDPSEPYDASFDTVRPFFMHLLGVREYPLASRLHFLAYFATSVSSFFHRDAGADASERLMEAIAAFNRPVVLAEHHRGFAGLGALPPVGADALQVVLAGRLRGETRDTSLRRLVSEVWGSLGGADPSTSAARVWAEHRRREAWWRAVFGTRLDRCIGNLALHYCFDVPYIGTADLTRYVRALLVRIAMVRFLLLGHPRLEAARTSDEPPGSDARREALDRTLIEVCVSFFRHVGHNPGFLEGIETYLDRQGFTTLAHLVLLNRI